MLLLSLITINVFPQLERDLRGSHTTPHSTEDPVITKYWYIHLRSYSDVTVCIAVLSNEQPCLLTRAILTAAAKCSMLSIFGVILHW